MTKNILSSAQIYELISANKYAVEDIHNMGATSYPQSAEEELKILQQTGAEYGFELGDNDTIQKLLEPFFPQKEAPREYDGAVLFVTGHFSVQSIYRMEVGSSAVSFNVFVYHKQAVDELHKKLAAELVEKKLVALFEGLDAEYLYEVFSSTFETMMFEYLKKTAHKLPIYEVSFSADSTFTIEERGEVV